MCCVPVKDSPFDKKFKGLYYASLGMTLYRLYNLFKFFLDLFLCWLPDTWQNFQWLLVSTLLCKPPEENSELWPNSIWPLELALGFQVGISCPPLEWLPRLLAGPEIFSSLSTLSDNQDWPENSPAKWRAPYHYHKKAEGWLTMMPAVMANWLRETRLPRRVFGANSAL